MAIFHLDLRHISRKNKSGGAKSAASIVAYRERCKIGDFNYSNKTDFVTSFCLFPPEFSSSDFAEKMRDSTLFSEEIEKVEKRRDSQLFDEIILALPHELTLEKNQSIIVQLVEQFYVEQNNQMARVCIHRTKSNLHAHVLVPQRPIERTESGLGFGKKIREDFSRGKPKNAEKVISMRSKWAELVNQALSDVGEDKQISHLSLKELKKEAERVFDFKKVEFYDRSPFYLPVSAYRRAEFIVSKDDRFSLDFEAMKTARKFAARRAEPESLTLEDLKAEQKFWRKIESENQLRTGSIQLARKFAKRAEKSVFRKNAVTKFFEKNYETTRDFERGFENTKTYDSRAEQHSTQFNFDSSISREYNRFNADRYGSETNKSNAERDVPRRRRHEGGNDGRREPIGLGGKNFGELSRKNDNSGNSNPHAHQQREVFKIFSAGWNGQSHHSSFGKSFENGVASCEFRKSKREKGYTRAPSPIPKRRRRVSR